MECLCVDPAHAAQVWPLVSHLIVAAMRKGDMGEYEDVEKSVLEGPNLLWVAADMQAIWAAAVTELCTINDRKLCTILACGGRERERWLPFKERLEQFARDEGCCAVRIIGRRGWAREFPDYKLTRIMLEKAIT